MNNLKESLKLCPNLRDIPANENCMEDYLECETKFKIWQVKGNWHRARCSSHWLKSNNTTFTNMK